MFDLLWVKHLRYAKEKKRDRKAWSKYVKKKTKKKHRIENSILKGELIFVRCCYTINPSMYILDS